MRYRVTYACRLGDDGLIYSASNYAGEVIVDAPTIREARLAAIDAAYANHASQVCSHVYIGSCEPVTEAVEQ